MLIPAATVEEKRSKVNFLLSALTYHQTTYHPSSALKALKTDQTLIRWNPTGCQALRITIITI